MVEKHKEQYDQKLFIIISHFFSNSQLYTITVPNDIINLIK